jgi:hypothetical protein
LRRCHGWIHLFLFVLTMLNPRCVLIMHNAM